MKRIVLVIACWFLMVGIYASSVVFNKIWLEHGTVHDGVKGMTVHVAFDISGYKGQTCEAIAYFDYPKGTGLKDKNKRYYTKNGNVCSSKKFTPSYDNSSFSDVAIFIPISELHLLSGTRTYYTRVYVFSPNGTYLGNSNYASFDGTGGDKSRQYAGNYNRNSNSGTPAKTWRENLGYGMFAINKLDNNGVRSRTIYRPCNVCHGTTKCGNCYGTGLCTICGGRGGIVTAGYGTYIPCAACGCTGRCGICKGAGKCACTNYEYPGYMPGSTIIIGPDGKVLHNSRDYDNGSSSSYSSGSSSGSSRGTCPKCRGRRYESTPYKYAAASTSGWAQPYHNAAGNSCPYCNYSTDHYHYPCTECHGFGHK